MLFLHFLSAVFFSHLNVCFIVTGETGSGCLRVSHLFRILCSDVILIIRSILFCFHDIVATPAEFSFACYAWNPDKWGAKFWTWPLTFDLCFVTADNRAFGWNEHSQLSNATTYGSFSSKPHASWFSGDMYIQIILIVSMSYSHSMYRLRLPFVCNDCLISTRIYLLVRHQRNMDDRYM